MTDLSGLHKDKRSETKNNLWPAYLHLSPLNYSSTDGTTTAESQTQVISIKGQFLNEVCTVAICVMEKISYIMGKTDPRTALN